MKRAIEGLALESHPVPITSVHRQVKEYAEAIGDTVPIYWTVYDIVREMPPSLRTVAHQGAQSYGESFDLIHRREASKANSICRQITHNSTSSCSRRTDRRPGLG
jgi:putative transposase